MIAARRFTAIIGGKEKKFLPGDPVTQAEAKEINAKAKKLVKNGKAKTA